MAGRSKELAVPEAAEGSWERVAAREVSKLLLLAPPWIVGVLTLGLGTALHVVLRSDDPAVIAWKAGLQTACTMILAAWTWQQSHARSFTGQAHTTLAVFAAGMWVCAATINGPFTVITGRLALLGGITLALSFNIRSIVRRKGIDVAQAVADPLSLLFGQGAEKAGMRVEARTVKASAHKVEGEVRLDQGRQVAEDLAKKVPYVESGIGLPPGSISTAVDPDDASKAKVTVSDPRVMKHPILWDGPSRPGGSVGDPIRIGLWQDLDPVEYVIVGHHLQVMGMTGAGKSIGGAWNILGELITRKDVAIFAADITKGRQTLGPLEEALHRFETTKAGVKAMLRELAGRVKERTDQLSAKGLQKWKPGCGLTYWVIWLEECPDILDALTDKELEDFLAMLKAIRSAGGTVVLSLQRSDYSQMPTLARGQLAKMCFGVDSAADASFGLSERQSDVCTPERWTNAQPGMSYLDAPTIAEARVTMPLRTFAWGVDEAGVFDDEAANAAMREHAAAWPAAAKDVDPGTAEVSRISAAVAVLDRPGDGEDRAPAPAGEQADLLATAAELVVAAQYGSAAMVQRKLRIGFEHAKLLMGELERLGVVGPEQDGRREVLVGPEGLGEVLEKIGEDGEVRSVARQYQQTEDPDPSVQAGPDDEIPDLPEGEPPLTFAPPERKMTAQERGEALIGRLRELWDGGARDFSSGDLRPLWESTDMSRAWVQKQLKKLSEAGIIGRYDDEAQRYAMPVRPEV